MEEANLSDNDCTMALKTTMVRLSRLQRRGDARDGDLPGRLRYIIYFVCDGRKGYDYHLLNEQRVLTQQSCKGQR